ncbi:MAG: hypothetical protein R3E68_02865 [Burkholderiaceae bacterium]
MLGLAMGYEDSNDHDQLRQDALLAMACEQADALGERRVAGHSKTSAGAKEPPAMKTLARRRQEPANPHQNPPQLRALVRVRVRNAPAGTPQEGTAHKIGRQERQNQRAGPNR